MSEKTHSMDGFEVPQKGSPPDYTHDDAKRWMGIAHVLADALVASGNVAPVSFPIVSVMRGYSLDREATEKARWIAYADQEAVRHE